MLTTYADEATAEVAAGDTVLDRIFLKTGVRDRPQAMTYAYRSGLAQPPSG